MEKKAFVLQNKGMNRDLSISKAGDNSAYENRNIRISVTDHGTMLSVTNERGNKKVAFEGESTIKGTVLGWNVLNDYIIVFTHDSSITGGQDNIYRIEHNVNADGEDIYTNVLLYRGSLNFSEDYPIESIVYYETEEIQKIYWVDGLNVLRSMNFVADDNERDYWDDTYFDSNRKINFTASVEISKDNSGTERANGVVQYFLTYYNKHGQESGFAWVSDLVYLSPVNKGGSPDGTNCNNITLTISGMDSSYSNYRLYSVVRTAYNSQTVAYIVSEGTIKYTTDENTKVKTAIPVTICDTGEHLTLEDPTKLLYIGSKSLIADTLTAKDETLFLGNLKNASFMSEAYTKALKDALEVHRTKYGGPASLNAGIEFKLSTGDLDIPYIKSSSVYSYDCQLTNTSSQIQSFKGCEKYRFALVLRKESGEESEAFWIYDGSSTIYPSVDDTTGKIHRIIVTYTVPDNVLEVLRNIQSNMSETLSIRLMIAEASYADRSIKAQGIVSPTMFNVSDRYNDRMYSCASWIIRPRGAKYSWKHFDPVKRSDNSYGEIQCNYWTGTDTPTPYYRTKTNGNISTLYDHIDGNSASIAHTVLYRIVRYSYRKYACFIRILSLRTDATDSATLNAAKQHSFTNSDSFVITSDGMTEKYEEGTNYTAVVSEISEQGVYAKGSHADAIKELYSKVASKLQLLGYTDSTGIVLESTFTTWCNSITSNNTDAYYNPALDPPAITVSSSGIGNRWKDAANNNSSPTAERWYSDSEQTAGLDYTASEYKKHLMFIDENLVTLNSPEIESNSVSFDSSSGYKFRIVGVAKITDSWCDYVTDINNGALSGDNLVKDLKKSIMSWPLWREFGLTKKTTDSTVTEDIDNIEDRKSTYYTFDSTIVRYWLYMWNKTGNVTGYTDTDNPDYSVLKSKTFANIRYSYKTVYNHNNYTHKYDLEDNSIRVFDYSSSKYVGINVFGKRRYYDAVLEYGLSVPGDHKYPLLYSPDYSSQSDELSSSSEYLFTNEPVVIKYSSTPHAVISLGSEIPSSGTALNYSILPYVFDSEKFSVEAVSNVSGPILPWETYSYNGTRYTYTVTQNKFTPSDPTYITSSDEYLFIGEIYKEFDPATDTRYGGVTESAISNCRFIPAGPYANLGNSGDVVLVGNQGDTYFQRWDCLKTKPYADGCENSVIDITSVMLETHINIDGRYDNQRGVKTIASIDTENYGKINEVYSQSDNFRVSRDVDDDLVISDYASSITWTGAKADSSDVDEWTHITLASSLKLDGDKGICRALRRLQNTIIAFQDRGISEILFNSRTQLSTTEGVPVEIANSGKVDGKRYISNKYGCRNKWSIVEGKSGIYFVDNINKAFCVYNGQSFENISEKFGFSAWFAEKNSMKTWNPVSFDNFIAHYDKVKSDIYLVSKEGNGFPCIAFNETLGTFTSFYDYGSVPMMANLSDSFVSLKNGSLWLQNKGFYCNFFGEDYPYNVQYRVTPDPYSDKIWNTIEYRADMYDVLDDNGDTEIPEGELINGEYYGLLESYQPNDTFDSMKVWNEYQTTGEVALSTSNLMIDPVQKKFRIWRMQIPRARLDNKYTLDRIRNPWIHIIFNKDKDDKSQELMQLHDMIVTYFE